MHDNLTFPPLASSAHWASASDGAWGSHKFNGWRATRKTTDEDDRDAHKSEKLLAFFVVLSGYPNGSPCEFIHFFSGTCFLCLFTVSFCLLSSFKTFCELHMHILQ